MHIHAAAVSGGIAAGDGSCLLCAAVLHGQRAFDIDDAANIFGFGQMAVDRVPFQVELDIFARRHRQIIIDARAFSGRIVLVQHDTGHAAAFRQLIPEPAVQRPPRGEQLGLERLPLGIQLTLFLRIQAHVIGLRVGVEVCRGERLPVGAVSSEVVVARGEYAVGRHGGIGFAVPYRHADIRAGSQRAGDVDKIVTVQLHVAGRAVRQRVAADHGLAGHVERAAVRHVHAAARGRSRVAGDRAA